MRTNKILTILLLLAPAVDVADAQQSTSYLRGHELYGNHCVECHASVVHIREDRKAKSIDEIEGFIIRWSNYRNLSWSAEEVNDVLHYLNTRYYKY